MAPRFIISEELRQALLAYLLTRPMQEVRQGVEALENLQRAPEPAPDPISSEEGVV